MDRYHNICKSVCFIGSPLSSVDENKEITYLAEKIAEIGNDLVEKLYAFTEDLFSDPDSKRDAIKPITETAPIPRQPSIFKVIHPDGFIAYIYPMIYT